MISSQKEVEFKGEDFDGIKKVYTIWLVMDAPRGGSNSIRRYEMKEKILHGHGHEDVKNYDLMVVIMVYLGKQKTRHRLLRLLHLIFLDKLKAAEKAKKLKDEYDLILTPDIVIEKPYISSRTIDGREIHGTYEYPSLYIGSDTGDRHHAAAVGGSGRNSRGCAHHHRSHQ